MSARSSVPVLLLASQVAGVVYLAWRLLVTHQGANPALFVLVILVDVWVVARHQLRCRTWRAASSIEGSPSAAGEMVPTAVLLDVGQEPLIQLRVAIRSCQEARGVQSLAVLDRLGRADVAAECQRARVAYVCASAGEHEVDVANAFVANTRAVLVAVVPASVWAAPNFIRTAGGTFASAGPDVAVVGLTTRFAVGASRSRNDSGYPLFDDIYSQVGEVGAGNGIVVFRAATLRSTGGFQGGSGVGNGSFVSRTVDRLAEAGHGSLIAIQPGGSRPAPWDEDQALRSRLDEVGRQQTSTSPRRVVEAWSVVPRAAMFVLPAVVALTGWLPFTASARELLLFAGPWFGLAALARYQVRQDQDWSDLRVGARTLTADLVGLARASALAIRPGGLAARHTRVLGFGALLAAIGCFAQVAGFALNDLAPLASALVIAASMALLGLIRDALWAQSVRQGRSLPRVETTSGIGASVSPLGVMLDGTQFGSRALSQEDEVRLALRIRQPHRNDWERSVSGVVVEQRATGQVYVQFDFDAALFDQLLYGCAVTEHIEVARVEPTGQRRSVVRRTLAETITRGRGVVRVEAGAAR